MWCLPRQCRDVDRFRLPHAAPGASAMNWTDERVELLRKLWAEGLSASQIAAQLGSVTRNAVIGKVHRLKLSGRGRSTASPAKQKKQSSPAQERRPRRLGQPARHRLDRGHGSCRAVRRRAGRPLPPAAGRECRGADLAPAAAGPAFRAHLQMAERRSADGGLFLLRQRLQPKPDRTAPITRELPSSRRRNDGSASAAPFTSPVRGGSPAQRSGGGTTSRTPTRTLSPLRQAQD